MSSLSAGEATGPSEDRATIAARAAVVAAFALLIAVAWLTTSKLISVLGICVAICLLLLAVAANLRQTFRRRKAEEYLDATEEQYRSLVDAIEDYAIFMLDPQGKIISWNTGAQRLKGYSASEIVGQHFSCFYTQQDRDDGHPQSALAVALRDRRYTEDGLRVRKDGSLFHAHVVITAVRDHSGNLMGFAKATQDLTHARAMDMAMREQAQILDLVNETIFVRDSAARIRYWNKGAERTYGWSREEAMGQVTHALLKTQFPEPLEHILSTLQTHGQWTGELKHVRRDGRVLHLSSNWVRHLADSDEGSRIIETNYDLTELKAMEQTLREKNSELESAARVKDRFLANMSHELRTPLNAIIGFCQLMEDGLPGPINATQTRYLSDVLRSARHLLQLINDLLDLTKIAAGKMELRLELFALAEAINEVCSGVQPLADIKAIKVTQLLENAPQQARLDTGRFKQILYNLLSNAIKFTPDRGTVAVEVDTPREGVFALKVRDTGIGIAPENMKRLFKEFEQLDDSTTRRHQGTGLGLALTRNLVELHGGTIRAESRLGHGSTFTVTLPDLPVRAAALS